MNKSQKVFIVVSMISFFIATMLSDNIIVSLIYGLSVITMGWVYSFSEEYKKESRKP